jgi:hypothetical protein
MQTYPASEEDIRFVASAFMKYRQDFQDRCRCCLDAEVDATLSVSGWFSNHTDKLSGYLQARESGNIKFVALNPLGQPVLILMTNGKVFKSLNIFQGKAYVGSTDSETFRKFVPPGIHPELAYYWLTGGIPLQDMEIKEIGRDRDDNGYWLQIQYKESELNSLILFDPVNLVVLRHIFINNNGDHLVDLEYGEYPSEKPDMEFCRFPREIRISSTSGTNKEMTLKLYAIIPDAEFSAEDLDIEIPENFELHFVN